MNRAVSSALLGCLALTLVCLRPGRAENPPAAPPGSGACDSPYPDAQGNVTFACRGLTDDQIRLLPSLSTLVNQLLNSGISGARLESQTGAILNMLKSGEAPKPAAVPDQKASSVPPPSAKDIISYDYRGAKVSSLTGLIPGDEGESRQYQNLLALQKGGEWKKLLKESAREIKKVPAWLTPYAFKAVALQHLGSTKEAITTLEYVDQRSKGNSDYDQVRRLLSHLQTAKP